MTPNGHTKVELQSWGAPVREGLGDYAEYHQPRQLREQIHSGRLIIKQSEGNGISVEQHPGYHLAAMMVNECEQEQKRAGERKVGGTGGGRSGERSGKGGEVVRRRRRVERRRRRRSKFQTGESLACSRRLCSLCQHASGRRKSTTFLPGTSVCCS